MALIQLTPSLSPRPSPRAQDAKTVVSSSVWDDLDLPGESWQLGDFEWDLQWENVGLESRDLTIQYG